MSKDHKYVFVEYNGEEPPCMKCIFADAPDHVCDLRPCRDYEREDGKNGYYRAANVGVQTIEDIKVQL